MNSNNKHCQESNPSMPTRSSLAPAFFGLTSTLLICLPAFAAEPAKPPASDEGKFTITGGASYSTSSLSGGTSTRAKWSPLLDLAYTHGRFSASLSGLTYDVVQSDEFTLGVGAAYSPKRKASDDVRLRGMGDVQASPLILLNATWSPLEFLSFTAQYSAATKRTNGSFLTVGTALGFPLMDKLSGFVEVSGVIADQKYMQAYYGVTAAQAATSGYRVFTPRAGLVNTSVSLGVNYEWSEQWSLGASVGRTRLMREAAKSPIFPRRDEPSANVFASYTF
jgi:outer membrane scaffolding protein for murein synthesis (MipA/OmpV family)